MFGNGLSISDDVAIVGAPLANAAASFSGAAYAYHFNGTTWVEQPKLAAADGSADDNCGWSAAVSGDVAILGAPGDDHAGFGSGSAYVFRLSGTWQQESKLIAPDATFLQFFGISSSIDGDVAVVGARAGGISNGSVYVYRYDDEVLDWLFELKLEASDLHPDDLFGTSVAVSGNLLVVGASGSDGTGAAYAFRYNGATWVQEGSKLTASEAMAGDRFGISVSNNGNTLLVGASGTGGATGAAYVFGFEFPDWIQKAILTAPDGAPENDSYGFSVSLSSDLAVVGAPTHDDGGNSIGVAYVYWFDGNNWTEQAQLTASDAAAFDLFGFAVSVNGARAVIGAPSDQPGGSTYVFDDPANCNDCPWDLDGGGVGVTDLLTLLGLWGTDPGGLPDFDNDQNVGVLDLLELLGHWGECS